MDEHTLERAVVRFELAVVLGENEGEYGCEYSIAFRDQDAVPEPDGDLIGMVMLVESLLTAAKALQEEVVAAAEGSGLIDDAPPRTRAERRRAERCGKGGR